MSLSSASSSAMLVNAAREGPDQSKPGRTSTLSIQRLEVASVGDAVVVRWAQSVKIDAESFAATMRALSYCGAPAILCLRGDAFDLEGSGTKEIESSILMTLVACARIDADALALVDDHSALTMCCATTTASDRSGASRADAVEMSLLRGMKLIPPREIDHVLCKADSVVSHDPIATGRGRELLTISTSVLLAATPMSIGSGTVVTLAWDGRGQAALIELDDPRTLNALTDELVRSLAEKVSFALASRTVRALVLQASGPHFCTGGRYEKKQLTRAPLPWWLKARGICGTGHVFDRVRTAPVLSFSVLHGSSIGGGLLLGLAADHRVATKHAAFRLGVAPYGLSPVVMATKVLPLLVGGSYATRMYVEDLMVDSKLATESDVAHHLFTDSRIARQFVETSARAGSHSFASPSMAIARHGRHHCQETLLDIEAG